MITVHHVNERNVRADLHLYCGRNGAKYPHLINSGLGNPFKMSTESMRDKICDAYSSFLTQKPGERHRRLIARIVQRITEGKRVALYCHCAPKRCHCDIIRDYALLLLKHQSPPPA
jgi:hypothetical protein